MRAIQPEEIAVGRGQKAAEGPLKRISKHILLSVARPFWRRAWHRIERRVAPIEARLELLDEAWHRFECRVAPIEARLELLDETWHRVERRVAPIEARLELLDGALSSIESRVASIETRLELLDGAWQAHIPSFLNAVATVPAISYEVAAISKRLEGAVSALSERANAVETRGKTTDASTAALLEADQIHLKGNLARVQARGRFPQPFREFRRHPIGSSLWTG